MSALPQAANEDAVDSLEGASLAPDMEHPTAIIEELRFQWELEGIQSALEGGVLGVASTLTDRLLQREDLERDVLSQLHNARIQIALIRGELPQARAAFETLEELGLQPDPLMVGFLRFFENDVDAAETTLNRIDPDSLSDSEAAWAQLLRALILDRSENLEESNEAFLLAERLCPTALLRDQFEIIRFRHELSRGESDEDTILALRDSVRSMRGERSGYEAARLLAVALQQAGDSMSAIAILREQLENPALSDFGLRPQFLLLLGTIAGPDTERGRLALLQLLSESSPRETQSIALTMLAQSIQGDAQRSSFLREVAEWLERPTIHQLADRLLAYQAYFLVEDGFLEDAEQSARQVLEQYPTSTQVPASLRLLAYISWKQNPPRYRTAADYLNQFRQTLGEGEEDWRIGVLIADCYFLNEDYASASDAYGSMLRSAPPDAAAGVFYQRVLSEIGAGRPDAAAALIDESRSDERMTEEVLWKAEWNLLDHLRREEKSDQAYARIQQLLELSAGNMDLLSDDLEIRFRWLAARLTLESGPAEDAIGMAVSLMEDMESGLYGSLTPEELTRIEGHLILIKGEAELSSGQKDSGLETFTLLREKYPQSGSAILSFLVESRSESDSDNLVSAQQSLIALVDRFPTSEYAPIALWEAALNAEQRGLNVYLQESIGLLERLVTEYPEHELVYFARLKQGNLARKLNDFPTALLLFERLLSQYPDHPERYRAELSRADCLMALGSEDTARFDQAAVIYERNCLLHVAPMPVRMEAGFKWAHSLRQQGDIQGCEAVLWLLYERFVIDPDMNTAIVQGEAGRYWVARILLELGELESQSGEYATARQIYETLLEMNLPGAALARSRIEAL
ncbi:MAG: tetratricopeptide repeat protein [Puniceicoccaceae bacterium]